jgi:hypothetical protein
MITIKVNGSIRLPSSGESSGDDVNSSPGVVSFPLDLSGCSDIVFPGGHDVGCERNAIHTASDSAQMKSRKPPPVRRNQKRRCRAISHGDVLRGSWWRVLCHINQLTIQIDVDSIFRGPCDRDQHTLGTAFRTAASDYVLITDSQRDSPIRVFHRDYFHLVTVSEDKEIPLVSSVIRPPIGVIVVDPNRGVSFPRQ